MPFSGCVDHPVLWPDFAGPTAVCALQSGERVALPTREVHIGLPRAHVSLAALFDALEAFSERNAVVLVRSWMHRVVCGVRERPGVPGVAASTSTAAPSSLPHEAEAKAALPAATAVAAGACAQPRTWDADPGYSDFPLAAAKSMTLLGSHTLYELVLSRWAVWRWSPYPVHAMTCSALRSRRTTSVLSASSLRLQPARLRPAARSTVHKRAAPLRLYH